MSMEDGSQIGKTVVRKREEKKGKQKLMNTDVRECFEKIRCNVAINLRKRRNINKIRNKKGL